jgi:hypothetical protein
MTEEPGIDRDLSSRVESEAKQDLITLIPVEGNYNPSGMRIIYIPPIEGQPPTSEMARVIESEASEFEYIHVNEYGSDLSRYAEEVKSKIGTEFDSDKLMVVGYCTGANLAMEVGSSLGLSKDNTVAISPYYPIKNRGLTTIPATIRSGKDKMQQRGSGQEQATGEPHEEPSPGGFAGFVGRVFNSDRLEGRPQSKIKRFINWRKIWDNWTAPARDLRDKATVISGMNDIVSPPGFFTDITVPHAGHDPSLYMKNVRDIAHNILSGNTAT